MNDVWMNGQVDISVGDTCELERHLCVPTLLLSLRLHLAVSQLASNLPPPFLVVFLLSAFEGGALLTTVWSTFSLPLTVFKVSCTLGTFSLRRPSCEPSQYPCLLSHKRG